MTENTPMPPCSCSYVNGVFVRADHCTRHGWRCGSCGTSVARPDQGHNCVVLVERREH